MIRFLLLRFPRTILTLLGVITLTFVLGRVSGDPVAMMLPQQATVEDYERMRAALGLDQPIPVQFARYVEGLARGDLGTSIVYNRPASEVVGERIGATLRLSIPAFVLSIALGLPLGLLAAYGRGGWFDRTVMGLSLAGQSLPSFAVGIVLILIFGVYFGLLPTLGSDTPAHYILPTVTMTIYPLAIVIRLTRSAILEVRGQAYVRTASAKGLRHSHMLPARTPARCRLAKIASSITTVCDVASNRTGNSLFCVFSMSTVEGASSMKRSLIVLLVLAVLALGSIAAAQDMPQYTVALGGNEALGTFFVGVEGMTLYTFTNDEAGVSNCVDNCAANWPPLTVAEGEVPTLDPAISGLVRTISRADGTRHVTYNGMPLYYWVNDAEPGDATGHAVNDVWFVATMPNVGLGGNEQLGDFLVGSNGFTLYTFANDEAGVSNCVDNCAANWPPLTVESADALTVQPGLVGAFGVIERADGSMQVTLNDMPLYFWVNDAQPGDATGHQVNDVWFVAKLPTVAAAENETFGQILTGPNGMSVYTFANDAEGTSNCVDTCAVNWPPLTVAADETITIAGEIPGELGTIERADGSLQVTYNGAPLYYWINDVLPGDTTGHAFRDVWSIALP